MRAKLVVLLIVVGVLLMLACSSSDSDGGEPACVPGATQVCSGVGACVGSQACVASGTGWGDCNCASGPEAGRPDVGPDGTTPDADAPREASASDAFADSSTPSIDAGGEGGSADGGGSADASAADARPPQYGVAFDSATTQRVEVASPGALVGTSSATFEGWFRLDTLTDNAVLFTAYAMDATSANVLCATAGASYPVALQGKISCLARNPCATCDPARQAWSLAPVPIGAWFHLAWVFDRGTFTMYIDGVRQSQATPDFLTLPAPLAQPFRIGGSSRPGETMTGIVDEFRVSSDARYTTGFLPPTHLDADATSLVTLPLDEGTGTTSAGGATLVGAPTWVSVSRPDGRVLRYGVAFDSATTQRVEVASPGALVGTSSATFEGWFRVDTLTDNAVLFTAYAMDATSANVLCATAGASYPVALQGKISCLARNPCATCDPARQAWSLAPVPIGAWFHLAWVFDRGTFTMYIHGVRQSQATPDFLTLPAPLAQPFRIGGSSRPGETMTGIVDEFRVSSNARYTAGFVPPTHLDGDATSLVTLPLDEGTGTTSAGGATLVGAPTWVSVSR